MAKEKLVPIVSPIGELHHVNISGQGKENYDKDGYEYTATVRLTGERATAMKAIIDDQIEQKMPSGDVLKSPGYKELVKDSEGNLRSPSVRKPKTDDEELSGVFAFSFKTTTDYGAPEYKPKKIGVRNANAQPVSLGDKRVGNGTIGAASGKMRGSSYNGDYSLTLYLNAIQIVKFVEYVGDDGFDSSDEGDFEGVEDDDTGFVGQPEDSSTEDKPAKTKPKL